MDIRKMARRARLGMVVSLLIGGAIPATAADAMHPAPNPASASATEPAPKTAEPAGKTSGSTAAGAAKDETKEMKAKREEHMRKVKKVHAEELGMDLDRLKVMREREKARVKAEQAKKTGHEAPAENDAVK